MRCMRLVPAVLAMLAVAVQVGSAEPQSASRPTAVGIISGRVVDSSGDPVEYADLVLAGMARGTTTDANGRFILKDVPAGRVTLVVRRSGLVPIQRAIDVAPGQTVDVRLVADQRPAVELPTVEVHGRAKIDVKNAE